MSNGTRDPTSLAEEYLDALEQDIHEERQLELEEKLEVLRGRRERYVEQHGSNSGIVQRVDRKIEDVDSDLAEIEESVESVDAVRTQLLQAAKDGFELSEEWLDTQVLLALTHALYGERDSWLCLDQIRIQTVDDLSGVNDLNRLDMEHTLLLLVEDRLGKTDIVAKRWERLSDSKYYEPFFVVTQRGEADPEDVVEALDDSDVSRKDAKNWLERPMYDWDDLIPYYRAGKGEFGLSTAGKYFAQNYAIPTEDQMGVDEETSPENPEASDSQTSFDDVAQSGGDSDE